MAKPRQTRGVLGGGLIVSRPNRKPKPPKKKIPTLVVTGTLTPDAAGRYLEIGTACYKHESKSFYIYWFEGGGFWNISAAVGGDWPLWAGPVGASPIGRYPADLGTGTATVVWE